MTTATHAVQFLNRLLGDGSLEPQYGEYVTFLTGTETPSREGRAEAEAALEQCRRYRTSDFSAGIKHVAQGIRSLAQVDTGGKFVKMVEVSDEMPFPAIFIRRPSQMVVVLNREAPQCCEPPTGSDIFAPSGRIGLEAVTLQVGYSGVYKTQTAELGLILPYSLGLGRGWTKDRHTVAAIELTGKISCLDFAYVFHGNGPLMHALGLVDLRQAISIDGGGDGRKNFDDAIGFPGATNFLADSLPGLGEYFTALAERFSAGHTH